MPPRRRPGPNWGTQVIGTALRYFYLSNWAPAFAGVEAESEKKVCFPPEGECPVWIPAFAGKHS